MRVRVPLRISLSLLALGCDASGTEEIGGGVSRDASSVIDASADASQAVRDIGSTDLADTGQSLVSCGTPSSDYRDQAALEGLEGCQEVFGRIVVGRQVTSFAPLYALRFLHGALQVRTTLGAEIENLDGLETLEEVDFLDIRHPITDFRGLSGLRRVNGAVALFNTLSTDLSGLEGLRESVSLDITNNERLETLSGLSTFGECPTT